MYPDDSVYEGSKPEAVVKPTVAIITKVKNGYIVTIDYDEFIAKTEYDISDIIKRGLAEVEK